MISSNYNATDGLVINTKYERFSFRANGNYEINDIVSAGQVCQQLFLERMEEERRRERGRIYASYCC